MKIEGKVAVVTGAASGIGEAVARELAMRQVKALLAIDRSPGVVHVARRINELVGRAVAEATVGDATDSEFRSQVFDQVVTKHGMCNILVPAAGITRDALAVKVDKESGQPVIYPLATFREVIEVNLIAPVYWALEMVARIAAERWRRGLGRWQPDEKLWGTIVLHRLGLVPGK